MKGYLIKPDERRIVEVEIDDKGDRLAQCQALVGGYLTIGSRLDGKHILYVDEEGGLKNLRHGFLIEGSRVPLVGNGLILGLKRNGEEGPEPHVPSFIFEIMVHYFTIKE